jgi:hypothetical protein
MASGASIPDGTPMRKESFVTIHGWANHSILPRFFPDMQNGKKISHILHQGRFVLQCAGEDNGIPSLSFFVVTTAIGVSLC